MRVTLRLLVTLCWLIPLSSCTANYIKNTTASSLEKINVLDKHRVVRNQSFALHPASKIYIHSISYSTKSRARKFNAPAFPRTQFILEKSVLTTFRSAFPFAIQGVSGLSLQESFSAALDLKAQYLIYPYVSRFNDNLNTASEISEGQGVHEDASYGPDNSTINLVVFDVYSQKMLDLVKVHSEVRWFKNENKLEDYFQDVSRQAIVQLSNNRNL